MPSSMKFWIPEIVAAASSALYLLALSVLLSVYDNKPIFSWYGITLNTVVSLLSTASKAFLMLAVGEAMGQWKWILFSRERRLLIDFERLDSASRGPLGSLKMLWHGREAKFAIIGAVAILLAVAIDPFVQQLVQYRQDVAFGVDKGDSTIARAARYSKGTEVILQISQDQIVGAEADFAMQSAVLYGLSQPRFNVVQQLPFSCPSGNCVAVNNMTAFRLPNSLIIDSINDWTYDKPSGSGSIYMTTLGIAAPNETNSMSSIDSLIWAMSVLKVHIPNSTNASSVWPDFPLEAIECGVYYCVNEYRSIVERGALQEAATRVPTAYRNPHSWKPTGEGVTGSESNVLDTVYWAL